MNGIVTFCIGFGVTYFGMKLLKRNQWVKEIFTFRGVKELVYEEIVYVLMCWTAVTLVVYDLLVMLKPLFTIKIWYLIH